MEFLSNVYQPKLKSNRTQNYNTTTSHDNLLHSVSESNDEHEQVVHQDMVHPGIISVNDADTFILTTYEDVTHDNDVSHEDPNMVSHSELNHDNNSMEDCVEIVKHEQQHSLEDDGNTGAEVDYEEVCLYEESGNTPSVDCETIIGGPPNTNSANSDDAKFQYLDTNDFCIASMNPTRSQYSSSASSVIGASGTLKLKSIPMVSSSTNSMPSTSSTTLDTTTSCVTIATSGGVHIQSLPELARSPSVPASTAATSSTNMAAKPDSNNLMDSSHATNSNHQHQSPPQPPPNYPNGSHNTGMMNSNSMSSYCHHQREECDLFFDFLKKKIQRFPPEEITSIQVEFLNCVLRREAEHAAQKAQQQQQQQQHQHHQL